jgi:hypothetical protein
MLRSLNGYGAEISKYVKPGTPHHEMFYKINLATNILESLIKDYPEDKIQGFLYELIAIADEVYQHCQTAKDEYLAGAMSRLAGHDNNRTEEVVPAQA